MKIITLIENSAVRTDLQPEHGLSLYIETGGYRILFDMGQTDAFAENARKLGIDLTRVDAAVLSHGHYDHGGGLSKFLEINEKAPVYIHRGAFGAHFHGQDKYIGLSADLADCDRIVWTEGKCRLAPGIWLEDGVGRENVTPAGHYGMNLFRDGQFYPDPFDHEQYLLIQEGRTRICISGCSHRGIENIANWFRPDVLVGGFHFVKLSPEEDREKLLSAAEVLLREGGCYYTGHCTGTAQYQFLKEVMGHRLRPLYTGAEILL